MPLGKSYSLSKVFEKAFAHSATEETLLDLLECIGEEIDSDRISVFEIEPDHTYRNTYEWCNNNIEKEKDVLRHVPESIFYTIRKSENNNEYLYFKDIEELKDKDNTLYEFFYSQKVKSFIISSLAFHGADLGFFLIENPHEDLYDQADHILPGMRYILSSLVYSDHLVHRLERIGYTDPLTGTGNRASLQEHIDAINPNASVGIIYCDALGWDYEDDRPEHLDRDMFIRKTGEVLTNVFDDNCVFRIATGEFLIVVQYLSEESFTHRRALVHNLFEEQDLLVATSAAYEEKAPASLDSLIRSTHFKVNEEIKKMQNEHSRHQHIYSGETLWHITEKDDEILYNGDLFFKKADELLANIYDDYILTIVSDINYFRLYNDIFGREAGNDFLDSIAEVMIKEARSHYGLAGYLGGDNFVLMIPLLNDDETEIKKYLDGLVDELKYTDGFSPAIGVYLSNDRQESMIKMYDRALSALSEIKGDYIEHYRFYNAQHFINERDNKLLLLEIRDALPKGEFIFYLQPQVHERTGKIIGAEALVRWNHDGKLISPGLFIPELEKNGYIYSVDTYVWEEVCKWIKSLKDRGIKPLPISVNVSRVDFYFTDIAQHFIDLVNKYDIEPELLGVEITESAFTDNTDTILEAIRILREKGFRILMDDFGSGSSSLSMLHEMNLDVLKTDVRFMSKKDCDVKAISIVESIISMAHMIGMLVVTEGVETQNQRDNLIALGDNYAQGYFFFKPMPVEEFEKLLVDENLVGEPPKRGGRIMSPHLKLTQMVNNGTISNTLLDNIVGPAAVLKIKDDELSLVQVNEHFCNFVELDEGTSGEELDKYFNTYPEKQKEALLEAISKANSHPLDGDISNVYITKSDGTPMQVELRTFILYTCQDHHLYLVTLA